MSIKKDGPVVIFKVNNAPVRITHVVTKLKDNKITFNFLDMRKTDSIMGASKPKSVNDKTPSGVYETIDGSIFIER